MVIEMKKSVRKQLCTALVAAAVCVAGLCAPLVGCSVPVSVTAHVGDLVPESVRLLGNEALSRIEGVVDGRVTHAGTYDIPAQADSGKSYTLRLKVVDYTAPVVVPRHVYCALGTLPEAVDCIGSIKEPDTYTAAFEEALPDMSAPGDYPVSFRVTDASGNSTGVLETVVSVIRDTEPPVFVSVPELHACVGDAIAYRDELVVQDNCCGEVDLQVDSSAVNMQVPGDYTVTYTATDVSGNTSSAKTILHLSESPVSSESLNRMVDDILSEIVHIGMTVEDQLRAVYEYIQAHIYYSPSNDTGDKVRIACESLTNGTADCYAYNAVAIAFLERLGVDYREIQRTPGLTADTHYWLMVNIGTASAPRWYHYDCTRLQAAYNHSGCLLTDKQIRAYSKVRSYFYAYDTASYPTCATEIITRTPELEPYYS